MFGLVYMQLKENSRAEESFERALRLSPNDADINHNYGWFLCQTRTRAGVDQVFPAGDPQPAVRDAGALVLRGRRLHCD